ncbi:MAG: hypothetical protein ACI89L_001692, partial [Phycisphaerales bacterium]
MPHLARAIVLHAVTVWLVLAVAAKPAAADITYRATGVVTNVHQNISSVRVGDVYTATIVVNEATADVRPGDPQSARYEGALVSYTIDIGGVYTYSGLAGGSNQNIVEVYNDVSDFGPIEDTLDVEDINPGLPGLDGYAHSSVRFFLVTDSTATALGDDSIPSSLPPFSGWATSEWSMSFTDGAFAYSVGGVLTDLTVVQERCVADATYRATGVVTNVHQNITSVRVGDVYTATIVVNGATADVRPGDPQSARYEGALVSYTIDIGGVYTYSGLAGGSNQNIVEVYNDVSDFG